MDKRTHTHTTQHVVLFSRALWLLGVPWEYWGLFIKTFTWAGGDHDLPSIRSYIYIGAHNIGSRNFIHRFVYKFEYECGEMFEVRVVSIVVMVLIVVGLKEYKMSNFNDWFTEMVLLGRYGARGIVHAVMRWHINVFYKRSWNSFVIEYSFQIVRAVMQLLFGFF